MLSKIVGDIMSRKLRGECLHCRRTLTMFSRGLCQRCFRQEEVRSLYARGSYDSYEPTQEEVERTIAKQLANLPDWWNDEPKESTEERFGIVLSRVQRRRLQR
jgi:hypothetical protein